VGVTFVVKRINKEHNAHGILFDAGTYSPGRSLANHHVKNAMSRWRSRHARAEAFVQDSLMKQATSDPHDTKGYITLDKIKQKVRFDITDEDVRRPAPTQWLRQLWDSLRRATRSVSRLCSR